MASSAVVASGDTILASQYNNLRIDVIDTTSGHTHNGTDSKAIAINATNFEYASNVLKIKALGVDTAELQVDSVTGAKVDASVVDNVTLEQTGTTLNVKNGGLTGSIFGTSPAASGVWTSVTNYVVPQGLYMIASNLQGQKMEIQVSATWYNMQDSGSSSTGGLFYSDGTNFRVTGTFHYLKY